MRSSFVAGPGRALISCDYSQVELRLLAHFSGDVVLRHAICQGIDGHVATAAMVFGVETCDVTSEQRSIAKGVNYALIYGQTPAGLAASLGIDVESAARYIDRYFDTFQGVADWLAQVGAEARRTRQVVTMHGRQRSLANIQGKKLERIAANTILQGSAAELMKLAMIKVERLLAKRDDAQVLLTIHDELLVESDVASADEVSLIVQEAMVSAVALSVPLEVTVGIGPNWAETKA